MINAHHNYFVLLVSQPSWCCNQHVLDKCTGCPGLLIFLVSIFTSIRTIFFFNVLVIPSFFFYAVNFDTNVKTQCISQLCNFLHEYQDATNFIRLIAKNSEQP